MTTKTGIGVSTFDYLASVLREIAGRASEGAAYRASWGDKFACDQVGEAWKDTDATMRRARNRRLTSAAFWEMRPEEMRVLGFAPWDDSGLMLIPLWAFNYIADGEVLTCIDGRTAIFGKDAIDNDVRFGCIAHGFAKAEGK